MSEDLSQWIGFHSDGSPKPKPGLTCLPKMQPTPSAAKATKAAKDCHAGVTKQTTGKDKQPKQKAASDRFKVLNAFVDCSLSALSRSEIAVWLILYRDTRDGSVRESQANIARRAGTSVRGVNDAITKLTSAGLLTVVFRGGINRGPSRYRVNPLVKRTS
jgi:hypothetical protein